MTVDSASQSSALVFVVDVSVRGSVMDLSQHIAVPLQV